jgi:hypothetical protein
MAGLKTDYIVLVGLYMPLFNKELGKVASKKLLWHGVCTFQYHSYNKQGQPSDDGSSK